MIDAARAALLAIDERRDAMEREEDALEQLCLAWEAYVRIRGGQELLDEINTEVETAREARAIEPPGQVSEKAPPMGSPAPASTPKRLRSGAAPASGGEAASSGLGAGDAAPAAKTTCPDCGGLYSVQGMGPHRARHRRIGARQETVDTETTVVEPAAPATNGKPGHPSGTHKYLCGRNCGRSFLSRQGRDDHEAEATCHPKPTPPPAGREPLGPLSGPGATTRSGGFGQ